MLETVFVDVFVDFPRSVTDLGHSNLTLELPADTIVNTPWLSPFVAQTSESVGVMSHPTLDALFFDVMFNQRLNGRRHLNFDESFD